MVKLDYETLKMANFLVAYDHSNWHKHGLFPEKWFERIKAEVFTFPLEKGAYWTAWKNRLPFFIPKGFPLTVSKIERELKCKFDFIFEMDGSIPYHLSGLKRNRAKCALWSMDIYRKDKQKFHKWMEEDFDLIFVAHKSFLSFFSRAKTVWLPYACDPTIYKKYPLPKLYDVAFVGNLDPKVYPERAKLLDLLKRKFNVTIFSNFYGDESTKWGKEQAQFYSQAKIVFNKSGFGEINLRIFETLGCGSLLVSDRLPKDAGLEELFCDGKHLVLYDSANDLMDKVDYYLRNEDKREEIAGQGYRETLSKHTFEHRAQTIFEIMKSYEHR